MLTPLRILATLLFLLPILAPDSLARPAELVSSAAPPKLSIVSASFTSGNSWPAASPITITVSFDQNVVLASWQWVGADGKTVSWSGEPLAPSDLRPTGGVWVGTAAAPPAPGNYKVRVTARAQGSGASQDLTLNLTGTSLPDEARPTRGYLFVRDGNIWLRSLDLQTERALTFYGRPGNTGTPVWSPDGRRFAFVRDRGTATSTYDLWVANADGTGAHMVAEHGGDRALGYPLFGPDGTLYVSVARPLDFGGIELDQSWDLARVDQATGNWTPLVVGALMPDLSPDGKRLVYIQQTINSDGGVEYSLVTSDLDGGNERLMVPSGVVNGLYAPAWSPDGKTILFATQSANVPQGGRVPGLAAPLAHGGPWDLYTMPAAGGTPKLLSAVQEDLPYPRWLPDGTAVMFISPTGLWRVPAAGGPPELVAPNTTHSELNIFAPQPQRAAPLTGTSRLFPETGKTLRGIFLDYWSKNGGLAQFGFPITDELIEEGRTVQYTQRARLEWHPEFKGSSSEVLLGRLGADVSDARSATGDPQFAHKSAANGAHYFPETGHNLAAPLRSYWESQGGLPVFGFPMSEAFQEKSATDGKTYLVQYFERNRLEYHPEFAGSDSEVLLGLLGVQEYGRRYGK